ncbi:MAG: YCF48-related protein [Chitinispirillaceae bacterium]|nr:YCF48-related protein [Chitinispirillaceae bacterium]
MKKLVRSVCLLIILFFGLTYSGLKWKEISTNFDAVFFGFSTNETGWAIGGVGDRKVFITFDGGKNWKELSFILEDPNYDISVKPVFFYGNSSIWILIKDTLYHSTDHGNRWNSYLLQIKNLEAMYFLNETYGVASDDSCRMYWTSDCGKNWQKAEMDTANVVGINSIYFIDSLNGWIAGLSVSHWDAGSILRTYDGGKSWKTILITYMLNDIYCLDSLNCFAAGFNWITRVGLLLVTNDGWKTYREIRFDSLYFLERVVFFNHQIGLVRGTDTERKYQVWETEDSGKTWRKVENIGNVLNIGRSNNALFISSMGKLYKCEFSTGALRTQPSISRHITKIGGLKKVIVDNDNPSINSKLKINLVGKTTLGRKKLCSGCYLLKDKK